MREFSRPSSAFERIVFLKVAVKRHQALYIAHRDPRDRPLGCFATIAHLHVSPAYPIVRKIGPSDIKDRYWSRPFANSRSLSISIC